VEAKEESDSVHQPAASSHGAIYMLRTVQQHHAHLSALADQKAGIIIAANSILFSLALTRNLQQVDWAALLLMAGSAITVLFALLVVAPFSAFRKSPAAGTRHFNLLFFGHFSSLGPEEFSEQMHGAMKNDAALHETMIRDIYQLGMVLAKRKYRFLGYAGVSFMLTLVLSVGGFILSQL
jgi:hypothetical protein